jgi:formylglycine-generating enzyme required for sulfatase activity
MFPRSYVFLTAFLLGVSMTAGGQSRTVPPIIPFFSGVTTTLRDCPECPEMVVVPSGAFLMGSPTNEPGRYGEEGPQRMVKIRSFAVGRYDVTRGQWAAFVRATHRAASKGCDYSLLPKETEANASWMNLGFAQDDSHPVVCVSWRDAHDYAQWLAQKSGHKYRLLTEAEWEYAARAGTTTPYPWGSTASHEHANYGGDDHAGHGLALGRDRWVATSPVGSFPPNAFNLFDMHGNVMQWVEDCYSSTYAGLPADGSVNTMATPVKTTNEYFAFMNGASSCSYRILRGGCWGDTHAMIRSAYRNFAPGPEETLDTYRSTGLGIRIARDLD